MSISGKKFLKCFADLNHFLFQSKALGKILFEQVCKQLNLLEVDYFGLEYQDVQGITVNIFLIHILNIFNK